MLIEKILMKLEFMPIVIERYLFGKIRRILKLDLIAKRILIIIMNPIGFIIQEDKKMIKNDTPTICIKNCRIVRYLNLVARLKLITV